MADRVKLVANTRIYSDVRTLLNEILDITCNFPRSYKFSVGNKMHELSIEIMQDIAEAYMNRGREQRIQHLVNFQSRFETLKTLIRISADRGWIKGKGRHAHLVELVDAIGKQSSAWKNYLMNVKD